MTFYSRRKNSVIATFLIVQMWHKNQIFVEGWASFYLNSLRLKRLIWVLALGYIFIHNCSFLGAINTENVCLNTENVLREGELLKPRQLTKNGSLFSEFIMNWHYVTVHKSTLFGTKWRKLALAGWWSLKQLPVSLCWHLDFGGKRWLRSISWRNKLFLLQQVVSQSHFCPKNLAADCVFVQAGLGGLGERDGGWREEAGRAV